MEKIKKIKIETLQNISVRLIASCKSENIETIQDIIDHYNKYQTFLNLKKLGLKSIVEILELYEEYSGNILPDFLKDWNDIPIIELDHKVNEIKFKLNLNQSLLLNKIGLNKFEKMKKSNLRFFVNIGKINQPIYYPIKMVLFCTKCGNYFGLKIEDAIKIGEKKAYDIGFYNYNYYYFQSNSCLLCSNTVYNIQIIQKE